MVFAIFGTFTGVVVLVASFLVAGWYLLFKRRGNDKNRPPLVGPSWRENLKAFSTIDDGLASRYPLQFGRMLEAQRQNNDGTCAGTGAIFRLNMPQMADFVICSDFKIAKVILEGDESQGIAEIEKSSMLRQFDTFPGRASIHS